MDGITLAVFHCTVEDVLGTLGPYMQDYIQRDGRFRDGLGIYPTSSINSVSIDVGTISGAGWPIRAVTFAKFVALLENELSLAAESKLCIDFIAHIPREHVVYLGGDVGMGTVRGIVAGMPKIQELHLTGALLVDGFLQPDLDGPLANNKLLPSLRRLRLEDTVLNEDEWSPIIPYLTHQASGCHRISLTIGGEPQHICKDVLETITDLVEELVLELTLDDGCPFDYCSTSEEEE